MKIKSSQKKKEKCSGCNLKKLLKYGNENLCISCYSARFQSVSSGNQDIDNLIKVTHNNNPNFRLEWIPFEDFTDIQRIAEGGFSTIFAALWAKGRVTSWSGKEFKRAGREKVVLKVLKNSKDINSAFIKELQNIAQTQPNSSTRYLVRYYGVSKDPKTKNYIFVMPFMQHGSLHEYLSENFNDVKWMDWGKIKGSKVNFLRSLVAGIKWIHQKNIIHRDIHSGNILIHQNYDSLIADLGFSRPANEDPGKSIYGIMPYIAPEIFNKQQFSFSSDIYSLGMIMWELTTGRRPFCDRTHDLKLAFDVCRGLRPEVTEDTPELWAGLMKKCWHPDPLQRPSIGEVHKIINSLDWEFSGVFYDAEKKFQEIKGNNICVSRHKSFSQRLDPIIESTSNLSKSIGNYNYDLFFF